MNTVERIKKWYEKLPDKKRYVELVTALLSVPVLITVLLLNVGNLKGKKDDQPQKQGGQTVNVTVVPRDEKGDKLSPTPQQCKKEVGPVDIVYPKENQTVTDTPLCIDISHKSAEYCSVVWSYKIDNGQWSSDSDKEFCFYNLPSGEHKLQLKVKSTVSKDEVLLERKFIYQGTPTPSPTSATDSADLLP
ncbi:hypothetical protein HYT33_02285 [Candidatus Roizmanbacteria bacterium]|nr:hypothetical protein [Candidatus Roizmanbacteria bacterium]